VLGYRLAGHLGLADLDVDDVRLELARADVDLRALAIAGQADRTKAGGLAPLTSLLPNRPRGARQRLLLLVGGLVVEVDGEVIHLALVERLHHLLALAT